MMHLGRSNAGVGRVRERERERRERKVGGVFDGNDDDDDDDLASLSRQRAFEKKLRRVRGRRDVSTLQLAPRWCRLVESAVSRVLD